MAPLILLVDDNAVQAATRNAILSRIGARILVAQQAQAALELMERPEIRSALRLLLTDHLMPGMNGPALVSRVRETLPELPVLVLSGLPEAEAEYESLQVSFQLKPFPPEELIHLVRVLIGDPMLRTA